MSFYHHIPGGYGAQSAGSSQILTDNSTPDGEAMACDISERSTAAHSKSMAQDDSTEGGEVSQSTLGVTAGARRGTSPLLDVDTVMAGDTSQHGAKQIGGEEHESRPLSRDIPTMEVLSQPSARRATEKASSENENEVSSQSECMVLPIIIHYQAVLDRKRVAVAGPSRTRYENVSCRSLYSSDHSDVS